MKLVSLVFVGSLMVSAAACGKKEGAGPEGAPLKPGAPVASAETVKAEPVKAEPVNAEPVNAGTAKTESVVVIGEAAGAAEHEGCGHAALEAAAGEPAKAPVDPSEKDCPFDEERAAEAAGGGCGHEQVAAAPVVAPAGATHLGAAFTIAEAKPLAVALGEAKPEAEPLVRVAGTVDKVCQKKGCWMVVRDGDFEARVIMKDHAFAIPFDAKGSKVSVEGTLKMKVFTEAQAKHLAEDGAEDPAKVQGEKKEFLLTATGVQLGG